ncbi:MAG: aldose epimerase [Lawsonibacter sp.]|nr:aldose epimerase [Lawsonibacter sp.]
MFTVTRQTYPEQNVCYQQLVLADTLTHTTATITPEKGGSVTGLALDGEEYLWLRHPNFEQSTRPRCGVPVLFPTCGLSPQGKNCFNGQDYPMSIHGFACLMPWQVVGQGTKDSAWVTLSMQENALTRVFYPFAFYMEITYRLKGRTLFLEQRIENRGETPMPFSFGYHPYFAVSDVRNLCFEVTAGREQGLTEELDHLFQGVDFPWSDHETTRGYREVVGPAVFTDRGTGHRVTVDFDRHFGNLILWSQCREGFVCVEPWNGWPGSLSGSEHEWTAPKQSWQSLVSITVQKV